MTLAALAEAALSEATIARRRARIEARLRSAVVRIFNRQRRAFPALRVARDGLAMLSAALTESDPPVVDGAWLLVAQAWPDEAEDLGIAITANVTNAAQLAGSVTLARIGAGTAWAMTDAVRERIEARALEAATSIDRTSIARIRARLVAGVSAGHDAARIARSLRAEMEGWTRSTARGRLTDAEQSAVRRADLIARTEVAAGWEGTAYDVLSANGWEAREWLTANDERVDAGGFSGPCVDNQAAGPVPVSDPFPSGHLYPPAHPLCRCTTVPSSGAPS